MELQAINESLKADRPFIKAEAVKEFAEHLKATMVQQERWVNGMDIDELLKEMGG